MPGTPVLLATEYLNMLFYRGANIILWQYSLLAKKQKSDYEILLFLAGPSIITFADFIMISFMYLIGLAPLGYH